MLVYFAHYDAIAPSTIFFSDILSPDLSDNRTTNSPFRTDLECEAGEDRCRAAPSVIFGLDENSGASQLEKVLYL